MRSLTGWSSSSMIASIITSRCSLAATTSLLARGSATTFTSRADPAPSLWGTIRPYMSYTYSCPRPPRDACGRGELSANRSLMNFATASASEQRSE